MTFFPANSRNALSFASLAISGLGGVYFGLFSCGGYASYKGWFIAFVCVLTALAMALHGSILKSVARRIAFPILVALVFVLAQALAAPFYPSAPSSVSEYLQVAWRAFVFGPC